MLVKIVGMLILEERLMLHDVGSLLGPAAGVEKDVERYKKSQNVKQ